MDGLLYGNSLGLEGARARLLDHCKRRREFQSAQQLETRPFFHCFSFLCYQAIPITLMNNQTLTDSAMDWFLSQWCLGPCVRFPFVAYGV